MTPELEAELREIEAQRDKHEGEWFYSKRRCRGLQAPRAPGLAREDRRWLLYLVETLQACIDETDEALKVARSVSNWQPIESAPRDDTDILLVWVDGHQQIDRLSNGEASFWYENAPTHWMPTSPASYNER